MKQSTWLRIVRSKTDVYLWCYAHLVVHARKEEENYQELV